MVCGSRRTDLLCRHLATAIEKKDVDYVREIVRHRKETEKSNWTVDDRKHGGSRPQLVAEFDQRAAAFLEPFEDTNIVEAQPDVRVTARDPSVVNLCRNVLDWIATTLPIN